MNFLPTLKDKIINDKITAIEIRIGIVEENNEFFKVAGKNKRLDINVETKDATNPVPRNPSAKSPTFLPVVV
ncbi:MAG: hypothetical protein WC697_00330 [Patescibacteria group bacterium]|jgi:hypothetical protein